jgi:hypothetical protein
MGLGLTPGKKLPQFPKRGARQRFSESRTGGSKRLQPTVTDQQCEVLHTRQAGRVVEREFLGDEGRASIISRDQTEFLAYVDSELQKCPRNVQAENAPFQIDCVSASV